MVKDILEKAKIAVTAKGLVKVEKTVTEKGTKEV